MLSNAFAGEGGPYHAITAAFLLDDELTVGTAPSIFALHELQCFPLCIAHLLVDALGSILGTCEIRVPGDETLGTRPDVAVTAYDLWVSRGRGVWKTDGITLRCYASQWLGIGRLLPDFQHLHVELVERLAGGHVPHDEVVVPEGCASGFQTACVDLLRA